MTFLVVMVAGMSSRFGGNPKQMAKVGPNNMTLIEYSINQALKVPFSKIIFITNPKTENLFIDLFGKKYNNIDVYYLQQEFSTENRIRPWGTGDAIGSLYPFFRDNNFNDNFIMINGDDIYGSTTFIDGFNILNKVDSRTSIIGGLALKDTLPDTGNVNRGIIFIENNQVVGLEEVLGIEVTDKEQIEKYVNNLANVNFIGLQVSTLKNIFLLNNDFKQKNKGDIKIESLLTDHLNTLIVNKDFDLKMEYFVIKNKIVGITNPGDEIKLKEYLETI